MEPLAQFSEAVQEYAKGDRPQATKKLSLALGAKDALPVVKESLDVLINPPGILASGMLRLMLSQERTRKRHGRDSKLQPKTYGGLA